MSEQIEFQVHLDILNKYNLLSVLLINQLENEGNASSIFRYEGKFDIHNLLQPCAGLFRFEVEVEDVANCLLPDAIKTPKRYSVGQVEAMCLVLRRSAYPNWWSDFVPIFKRSSSVLSGLVDLFSINFVHFQCATRANGFQRFLQYVLQLFTTRQSIFVSLIFPAS